MSKKSKATEGKRVQTSNAESEPGVTVITDCTTLVPTYSKGYLN